MIIRYLLLVFILLEPYAMYSQTNFSIDETIEYDSIDFNSISITIEQFDSLRNAGDTNAAYIKAKELIFYFNNLPDYLLLDRKIRNVIGLICYDISDIIEDTGDIHSALSIGKVAYDLLAERYGENSRQAIQARLKLSRFYSNLGLWDNAIYNCKELLRIIIDDKEHYYDLISMTLNRMSEYYLTIASQNTIEGIHDSLVYKKAIDSAILSYRIRNNYYGKKHPYTYASLFNIGAAWECVYQDGEGLTQMEIALKGMEAFSDAMPFFYFDSCVTMANNERDLHHFKKSIEWAETALAFREKYYHQTSLRELNLKLTMIECFYHLNEIKKIEDLSESLTIGFQEVIFNQFPKMNDRERYLFLNTTSFHTWFDIVFPQIIHKYGNQSEKLNILFFESLVFRKSILSSYKKNGNNSIYSEADFRDKVTIDFSNIKNQITEKDIVLDFFSFPDTIGSRNRHYSLMLLKRNSKRPKYVSLFVAENDFISLNENTLYNFVWKPVINEININDNIYFSPSGKLNCVPIENINHNGIISNKYNIYRLSSCLELLNHKDQHFWKNVALFGGIDYDLEYTHYKKDDETALLYSIITNRGGFEYLANTGNEVVSISNILKRGNTHVSIFSGKNGTEEAFKNLSGKGINIIHLATHAMYITCDEIQKFKDIYNLQFLRSNKDWSYEIAQEKDLLSRSFLVLSGGNALTTGKDFVSSYHDGILTASEIVELDFSCTDLVTLAACKTALGEINQEGIYGLQTAFKLAGANTILMSTSQVDDEATKILMVEFYKNLMNGKTKHQSLKDAQTYLREYDNGRFNDPKFWASFIMLDGLN